jgi:hypothetical protein
VGGYWDVPFEERGLVFAPIYFPRPLWVSNPNWFFYPRTVIGTDFVMESFFVGPRRHYYFGNYYGPKWQDRGFTPWVTHAPKVRDPVYSYYALRSPKLLTNLQTIHKERVTGLAKPPAKIVTQQNFVGKEINITNNKTTIVNSKTINKVNVKGPVQVVHLEGSKQPIHVPKMTVASATQIKNQTQIVNDLHASVNHRKELESKLVKHTEIPGAKPVGKAVSVPVHHIKLPKVTTAKPHPKVETPHLPGINAAAKPKPGVKPVTHPPQHDKSK